MLELYISPNGNDAWSGALPEPNTTLTNGPLATVARARDVLREKRGGPAKEPATVWIRGGRYSMREPLVLEPVDSHVRYAAFPGEQPILDGGRRIEGLREISEGGRRLWAVHLPEVARGWWYFRQLFVNGERRERPRLPKEGGFRMVSVPGNTLTSALLEGSDTFEYRPGDIKSWRNLSDVEVVAYHYWVDERMPILSLDEEHCLVKSSRTSVFALHDYEGKYWADYFVENIPELNRPGEWYLDRSNGRLAYAPLDNEQLSEAEIYAPVLCQLVLVQGDHASGRFVEDVALAGLALEHTDWHQPPGGAEGFEYQMSPKEYASSPQGASNIPGIVSLTGARNCSVEDCTVRRAGWYGVEIGAGCSGIRVVGNSLFDLGAGGIKINGSAAAGAASGRTGDCVITDNHVHATGKVFRGSVGILSMHAFGNDISHNLIQDVSYTGISCGWVWGFGPNVAQGNRIEKNNINNIGCEYLGDMGGIYLLGVQPGTVVRGNLLLAINRSRYGGACIYPDEGSAGLVIENNICYGARSFAFSQHFGRDNIVRNNIFIGGQEGQIACHKMEGAPGFTFERNIVMTIGKPVYVSGYASKLEDRPILADHNLLWDPSGAELYGGSWIDRELKIPFRRLQEWGYDRHSLVADPLFRPNEGNRMDLVLLPDSPALKLGFQPIDCSDVGPRKPPVS